MTTALPTRPASGHLFSLDFDALEEGMEFVTRGRTITEADVVSFAALTGDWHPQHTDAEWAKDSLFGERIAHGMLVVSYAVGLIPLDPERVVALRRVREATFKAPARIGDTMRVRGRIASLQPLGDEVGTVGVAVRIVDQEERLLVRATIEVIWKRGELA
jgi:acyl dehydratase